MISGTSICRTNTVILYEVNGLSDVNLYVVLDIHVLLTHVSGIRDSHIDGKYSKLKFLGVAQYKDKEFEVVSCSSINIKDT